MIAAAFRYWNTLRYLKPIQFYRRATFKLPARLTMDGLPVALRRQSGVWQAPVPRPPSLLGPGEFLLLNQRYMLPAVGGWDDVSIDKLRRYNLHYFEDLSAESSPGAAWHADWIDRWIAENPPTVGSGWEPYPISLRIVNWIKWILNSNKPSALMLQSLALQARWLALRIEWHLLGNHLLANAKALAFAGLFFEGAEVDQWWRTAHAILRAQLREQVLPDGGHFERSPMYHAIMTEDLLDLINCMRLWEDRLPRDELRNWEETAARMLLFLKQMTHPDGEIAFFNDASVGVASNAESLAAYADRLGVAQIAGATGHIVSMADSGYLRLSAGNAVAFLDVAEVGPDYLPGHAHADTLSFELSLGGRRLLVNSGTSAYGAGPVREAERGTSAHNTVEVDGENSSEVWGSFRVARRARPFGLIVTSAPWPHVECSHDGYRRLPGKPIHRRQWRLSDRKLSVEDTVSGVLHHALARFILAPGITVMSTDAGRLELAIDGVKVALVNVDVGVAKLAAATYAPEFGKRVDTICIEVQLDSGRSVVAFEWF